VTWPIPHRLSDISRIRRPARGVERRRGAALLWAASMALALAAVPACGDATTTAGPSNTGGAGGTAGAVGTGGEATAGGGGTGGDGAGGGAIGGSGGQGGQRACERVDRVVAGGDHNCALTNDGAVWCWGALLRLGVCEPDNSPLPWKVATPGAVTDLAAGNAHTCTVLDDGRVSCWGWNAHAQVGDGTPLSYVREPTLVLDDQGQPFTGAVGIAAGGGFSCALTDQAQVWGWGTNQVGTLGVGAAIASSPYPLIIPSLDDVVRIRAGNSHACALKQDASLWCWGWNAFGQVGTGNTVDVFEPVLIAQGVVAFALAIGHSCALDNTGSLACWGSNGTGQLGDGTTIIRPLPTPVLDPAAGPWTSLQAIGVGDHHTCAIDDGALYCWGADWLGQLGLGVVSDTVHPQPVPAASVTDLSSEVVGGEVHTCVVSPDGLLRCFGGNDQGELGNGAVTLGGNGTAAIVDVCNSPLTEPAICPP
jgi:Regulator of chromosome condensation (RCC1) repeat